MKKLLFAVSAVTVLALSCLALSTGNASASSLRGKHASAGISCTDCHKTDKPATAANESSCKECHGSYDKMAEVTKHLHGNPHNNHMGEMDCTKCHGIHKPTVIPCLECHADFELKAK